MRIAIDIRRINAFGVGAHIWNLVRSLAGIDQQNEYFLLGSRRQFLELGPLGPNFRAIHVPEEDSVWNLHVRIPIQLRTNRVDLLHVPHHETPLFVPSKLLV